MASSDAAPRGGCKQQRPLQPPGRWPPQAATTVAHASFCQRRQPVAGLPDCCQPVANLLPTCCRPVATLLPDCPTVANLLPTDCQPLAKLSPTSRPQPTPLPTPLPTKLPTVCQPPLPSVPPWHLAVTHYGQMGYCREAPPWGTVAKKAAGNQPCVIAASRNRQPAVMHAAPTPTLPPLWLTSLMHTAHAASIPVPAAGNLSWGAAGDLDTHTRRIKVPITLTTLQKTTKARTTCS